MSVAELSGQLLRVGAANLEIFAFQLTILFTGSKSPPLFPRFQLAFQMLFLLSVHDKSIQYCKKAKGSLHQ